MAGVIAAGWGYPNVASACQAAGRSAALRRDPQRSGNGQFRLFQDILGKRNIFRMSRIRVFDCQLS